MFARTQRLFQLSLITVFATLFFLGTAGVNTALAGQIDFLEGKTVIKEQCDNGTGKLTKRTIKSTFTLTLFKDSGNQEGKDACGTGCLSPFPQLSDVFFDVHDFFGPGNLILRGLWNKPPPAGLALTKNGKTGTFQALVTTSTFTHWTLNGKIVADGKTGVSKQVVGEINGYSTEFRSDCTYVGKFKGTFSDPPAPPALTLEYN